ncbi:MAG: ribbon-helix-helix domain-containing protein [Gammaproteobacteria bacterium]|nr:ribbon-helix-helix domain-containing protein [Gammaproteobacteria bacterium]MBU1655518.1 ribbon-helix-helix domain-containing protein [Gammaproteobacteria bacterium]MBU1961266.1 ribbon-helix-helix domain-containing protein [Gammaproteobacteria bacterium]
MPMKVAVSLPDPLFSAAEQMAQQLHVSRSQLYAQALAEYMEKRRDAVITQRLNAVYGAAQEGVDPALNKAQLKVLSDEAW